MPSSGNVSCIAEDNTCIVKMLERHLQIVYINRLDLCITCTAICMQYHTYSKHLRPLDT